MPFVSLLVTNVLTYWFPLEIDAYHAIKIKNLSIVVRTTGALVTTFAIAFDEIASIVFTAGQSYSQLKFDVATTVETLTVVIPVEPIDKIIGDYICVITGSGSMVVSLIVYYDIIKTSFDQYGQVSKTLKRVLGRVG